MKNEKTKSTKYPGSQRLTKPKQSAPQNYLHPEIFDGKDGTKKVSLPSFRGVAYLNADQFTWLVEQAKLGTFDDIIYKLVQES
jgi:hypothetical protein